MMLKNFRRSSPNDGTGMAVTFYVVFLAFKENTYAAPVATIESVLRPIRERSGRRFISDC
jgi:hypothetical protein